MRTASRALLLLIVWLTGGPAFAAACSEYYARYGNSQLGSFASYGAALNEILAQVPAVTGGMCAPGNLKSKTPQLTAGSAYDIGVIHIVYEKKVADDGCVTQGEVEFDVAAQITFAPASCEPERPPDPNAECASKSGEVAPINFTVGWSRIPGSDQDAYPTMNDLVGTVNSSPTGTTVCDGSCNVSVGALVNYWHAENPSSTGLYRISGDYLATQSGTSCSTKAPELDDTAAPQPCDGYTGSINGKTACVAPVGSTPANATAPAPGAVGNPAAGSNGSGTIGTRNGSSGGGNAGGPGSAIDGDRMPVVGGGGGSGEGEEQDGECGFGNNPPCKIDETNTPSDGDARFNNAQAEADEGRDGILQKIEEIKNGTVDAPTWSWTFSLPSGCSTIGVPSAFAEWIDDIDVCRFQPTIHSIMGFIWVLGTIFGCFSMVTGVVHRT